MFLVSKVWLAGYIELLQRAFATIAFQQGGPNSVERKARRKISCSLETILEPLEGPQGCPGVLKSNHMGPKKKPDFKNPSIQSEFSIGKPMVVWYIILYRRPGSSDPYYIASYYIKLAPTSWTYCMVALAKLWHYLLENPWGELTT